VPFCHATSFAIFAPRVVLTLVKILPIRLGVSSVLRDFDLSRGEVWKATKQPQARLRARSVPISKPSRHFIFPILFWPNGITTGRSLNWRG
jgi:hypothetical protein